MVEEFPIVAALLLSALFIPICYVAIISMRDFDQIHKEEDIEKVINKMPKNKKRKFILKLNRKYNI